ncbi:YdcF family protein [Lysinibacillus sp. FSL H8-0500]|uniref:YdcF family protein n=1 Tax=Lysinibacillus sp. FSL H8-0500 TaxID=2921393 RepID=UPI003101A7AE
MKKWVISVSVLLVGAGTLLYMWLGEEIERQATSNADGSADYMIILGAKVKPGGVPSLSLKSRLEVAVQYLMNYPHVKVVVSGGQGPDEDRTEASVMQEYLEQNGIETTRIIVEDQSTSTFENLAFSKELLPKETKKITIVSNDFHLKRATYLAQSLDFEVDAVAAETPKSVESKLRLRERAALLKTYIVGY